MESKSYSFNHNEDIRQLTFTPELRRITCLDKMKDPKIIKSPSWPSSPSTVRNEMGQKTFQPEYWTIGRKGFEKKVSDDEFGMNFETCSPKHISDRTKSSFEEIHSILSGMDLAKYYLKGPKEAMKGSQERLNQPLRRSVSVQPELSGYYNSSGKRSFLDGIPPPPNAKSMLESYVESTVKRNRGRNHEKVYALELSPIHNSSRKVSSKLKELTEKLRSSSAPPSPHRKIRPFVPYTAPPTSTISFWNEPLPDLEPLALPFKTNECMDKKIENSEQKIEEYPNGISKKSFNITTPYATLPRMKASENMQSKNCEPRTLASLDLNINFEQFRSTRSANEIDEFQKDFRNHDDNNMRDRKELGSENENIIFNETTCKESSINQSSHSNTSSRRSSLKNNSSSSTQRSDFDLNFKNYGSLTSNQEKKLDRKKNQNKFDSHSSNTIHRTDLKKMSMSAQRFHEEESDKKNVGKQSPEIMKDNNQKGTHQSEFSYGNENVFSNHTYSTNGSQTVPAVSSSTVNPLEEEIRTIAKLLDGKESLFLKLIQSSKVDNEERKEVMEGERELSQSAGIQEKADELPDLKSKNTSAFRSTGRNSPSRLRAMTVPGTEPNRNIPQKSPPPQQKRYYKKRLRGPYGEMLEQEMSKSVNKTRPSYAKDLEFLKELEKYESKTDTSRDKQTARPRPLLRSSSHSLDETHSITVDSSPKRKTSANIPLVNGSDKQESLNVPSSSVSGTVSEPTLHIRSHSDSVKTSSTWNVDTLLSKVIKQSTQQDTRTHIVGELYETEVSYVESLQIIIKKYMIPLKTSEHSAEIEGFLVDQIFYQVPEILKFHETFLDTLKGRLSYWDTKQKIGDVFVDVFTRPTVVDTYIEFINNWKTARDAIKSTSLAKPAFAKFLEHTSREHKGKLTLDALLIMPVQRIPRYELLIKELLKHTPMDHPDYKLLLQAQKEVHDLAIKINKVEREALLQEQTIQKLKEVEQLIEGVADLIQGDRVFIRHDFVQIPGGLGLKKERCVFLFSDLLLISSIKKKGGAIRKTSLAMGSSTSGSLESNKYKLLMKTPLHNVDIVKTEIDEPCVQKFLKDVATLENDIATLGKISDMVSTLSCQHQALEDVVKDMLMNLNRQLAEKQASSSHLLSLELSIIINEEIENITLIFSNPEQRMVWQNAFLEAKEKLDKYSEKISPPEFLCSLPMRKTRAGLQITCAAAVVDTCQSGLPDLWICSSDGYVGQVCVLTFQNEPVIATCANVSNARILCIAAVPGISSGSLFLRRRSTLLPYLPGFKYEKLGKGEKDPLKGKSFPLDSDSEDEDFIDATDDEFPSEDSNTLQPTMWLGTEDGCIYVYNCTDVKLRKTKLRIHHTTCIYDIVHVEGKVFVSLANGEIVVYSRDNNGLWNTSNPHRVQIASDVAPILKIVSIEEKLWCSTLNSIVILNVNSLEIEHTFQVTSELMRHITAIVPSGQGVWISVQSSPVIHLYHVSTYNLLLELNITTSVTQMLNACDEIIRQHKLACLRVSSLCVEKGLLWIGTSAGIILNLTIPFISSTTTQIDVVPHIVGMSHGHFGHVRFLTSICALSGKDSFSPEGTNKQFSQFKYSDVKAGPSTSSAVPYSSLVISGGDGYEDFGNLTTAETAGRDDSTNHLLMWRV